MAKLGSSLVSAGDRQQGYAAASLFVVFEVGRSTTMSAEISSERNPGRADPTETSPLLRSQDVADNRDPGDDNGSTANAANGGASGEADVREGNPEMIKKMHLLLPAVGIGVSHDWITQGNSTPVVDTSPDLSLCRRPAVDLCDVRQNRERAPCSEEHQLDRHSVSSLDESSFLLP